MIDKEIIRLRKRLDESIRKGEDYKIIYNISVELDGLITRYYNKKLKNVG